MLAQSALERGDSLWPSVAETSRRELARRDCSGLRVVWGAQEAGRSRQGSNGLRPLGVGGSLCYIGVLGGRWGVASGEDETKRAKDVLSFASIVLWLSIQNLHHLLSFLCHSVSSLLRFFSYLPAPVLCHMQTEGASVVEMLLAFGPLLGSSPAQLLE